MDGWVGRGTRLLNEFVSNCEMYLSQIVKCICRADGRKGDGGCFGWPWDEAAQPTTGRVDGRQFYSGPQSCKAGTRNTPERIQEIHPRDSEKYTFENLIETV